MKFSLTRRSQGVKIASERLGGVAGQRPYGKYRLKNKSSRRYLIISPCRNEAMYLCRTVKSVLAQTAKPECWVIVDDGSTDGTAEILHQYAKQYEWIHIVRREDRGQRSVGPGVVDAFYAGLAYVNLQEYDYICKLDMDLELPERYFERLMEIMESDERLGCVSGKAWYRQIHGGEAVLEKIGDHMSVGASKFYRTACFEQIKGLVRQVMWDGIDCHRCRQLGWRAYSKDEPDLRFEHLRPMGSSEHGILRGRMRHGYGQYYMGTSFVFMTASAIYRLFTPPVVVGSLAMWWGYVWAMLCRKPRYDDKEFRKFLRRWQRLCLYKGTARATAQIEREGLTAWKKHMGAMPDRLKSTGLPSCGRRLVQTLGG